MCLIKPECHNFKFSVESKFSQNDALTTYGLCRQAKYGDVQGERPSWTDIKGRYKWDAWAQYRGTSMDDAKRMCLNFVLPKLESFGVQTEDSQKDSKEKDYKDCLAKQGMDEKEIQKQIDQQQQAEEDVLGDGSDVPVPEAQSSSHLGLTLLVFSLVLLMIVFCVIKKKSNKRKSTFKTSA